MIVRERVGAPTGDREIGLASEANRPRVGSSPLELVLALLPVAAVTELLLIRTFYRVGVYIPKEGAFRAVYRVLTAAGSFALNLSSVLVVAAIALLAVRAWRSSERTTAAAIAAFLASWLVVLVTSTANLGPTARLAFVVAAVAVAWPFVRSGAGRWHRLAVAGVTLSLLLSSYAGLVSDAGRLAPATHGPGGLVGTQLLAEALVVATAFALFGSWARDDGFRLGPALLALGPALGLMVAWRANGAIAGILVLWTAGLRLYLPMALYAAALWAFSCATLGWMSVHRSRAAGSVLLLAAGLLLGSTYAQGLALVALVLLTDGAAVGGPVAAGGSTSQ
jgi:hypothetical protein